MNKPSQNRNLKKSMSRAIDHMIMDGKNTDKILTNECFWSKEYNHFYCNKVINNIMVTSSLTWFL